MATLTLTTVSNLHCLPSYLTTPSDLCLSAASAKSANVQCATLTVETEMTSFSLVAWATFSHHQHHPKGGYLPLHISNMAHVCGEICFHMCFALTFNTVQFLLCSTCSQEGVNWRMTHGMVRTPSWNHLQWRIFKLGLHKLFHSVVNSFGQVSGESTLSNSVCMQLLVSVSGICIFKRLDWPCLHLLLCFTTLLLQIRLAAQSMYAEKTYEALRMLQGVQKALNKC